MFAQYSEYMHCLAKREERKMGIHYIDGKLTSYSPAVVHTRAASLRYAKAQRIVYNS
jgi:hypothetical protein